MLLLAIDTATPAVTAGVVAVERGRVEVLAERVTHDPRAHGELITPHLLDAVGEAGVTLSAVEAIVCGNGPGPYTGLRAGMATAAALGHGRAVPVHPVCSLDAIAAEVAAQEPFLVVTDARRREVYWAAYDARGLRTEGPHVQHPGELDHRCVRAAGHGAALYADVLKRDVLEPAHPGPRGLALAARDELLDGRGPAQLVPLYLRRPHAAKPRPPKRVSA